MCSLLTLTEVIGKTPLVRLTSLERSEKLKCKLGAKLEYLNPGGSIKDRAALSMIETAEEQGLLVPGSTILEPTSGNTGIALAYIGALKGYKVITVLPKGRSKEKKMLMVALGAEVLIVEGGYRETCDKAYALCSKLENAIVLDQNRNPANAMAHYRNTGPEIWRDTDGKIKILVAGIGTGGTITGAGKYLKEQNPDIKVIGVEPAESPILSGGIEGCHGIQGIGPGFIPSVLDRSILDEVISVSTSTAYDTTLKVIKQEGTLVGMSAGAALAAAMMVAKKKEHEGKLIVTIFPSGAERYLTSPMFQPVEELCKGLIVL